MWGIREPSPTCPDSGAVAKGDGSCMDHRTQHVTKQPESCRRQYLIFRLSPRQWCISGRAVNRSLNVPDGSHAPCHCLAVLRLLIQIRHWSPLSRREIHHHFTKTSVLCVCCFENFFPLITPSAKHYGSVAPNPCSPSGHGGMEIRAETSKQRLSHPFTSSRMAQP